MVVSTRSEESASKLGTVPFHTPRGFGSLPSSLIPLSSCPSPAVAGYPHMTPPLDTVQALDTCSQHANTCS